MTGGRTDGERVEDAEGFFLGVTRTDKVRKARLTMLGHVQWRDSG